MFSTLTTKFRSWLLRQDTAWRLRMLDERTLSDIGTDRAHIEAFIRTRLD